MTEPEDIKRQTAAEYQIRKQQLQASEPHRKWKGLTGAQRFYVVGGAIFVIMLVAYLLVSYWGIPVLPGPSGEGG